VGRQKEMAELRGILTDHRLITLTDAGGSGKTRLAVELAAQLAAEFCDGMWCVDLAPITDPVFGTGQRNIGPEPPGPVQGGSLGQHHVVVSFR
jgi:hypothetical protein